ncbi:MAG: prepilin-type N-terminal cleavage/methylation domain-containing protein [Acidobacteria bacterium]|nr:prepilin-type N-terminal cleavage/methylation domain-containing protein [Acidobacteriota bacterium]
MNRHLDDADGFTLAELLVALALTALVMSAIGALAVGTYRLAESQPRLMDAQQRARVIAETLGRDVRQAGAGLDRGTMSGPLHRTFAAIWPRRMGRLRPDGTNSARSDVVTLIHVPDTLIQTTLATDFPSSGMNLALSSCPGRASEPVSSPRSLLRSSQPCRVAQGLSLAVFDSTGRLDLVGVLGSVGQEIDVRVLASAGGVYRAGSTVTEVILRGYYLDEVAAQLRYYDSDGTDYPVVDDVTGLVFEYFGDPAPPRWPRPDPAVANCLYNQFGDWLGGALLPTAADGLAVLPLAMFTDGPWCGAGDTAFDADLLRVRRVRVSVTVSSYQVVFDVAPPNLALGDREGAW